MGSIEEKCCPSVRSCIAIAVEEDIIVLAVQILYGGMIAGGWRPVLDDGRNDCGEVGGGGE
jgi:hypothetical protein